MVEVALNRLNPHSAAAADSLVLDDLGRDRCAISVVLPVYNEEGNLREVHRRLTSVLRALHQPYELIFVDDGSRDTSIDILTTLHRFGSGQHYRTGGCDKRDVPCVNIPAGVEYECNHLSATRKCR